jgi:glycolate oxidase iron-sulfur subunit
MTRSQKAGSYVVAFTHTAAIDGHNIGCLQHIQSGTATSVRHWIELLADRLI